MQFQWLYGPILAASLPGEVHERAPVSDQHAMWMERRNTPVKRLFTRLLHADRGQCDLQTSCFGALHRVSEAHHLHPIQFNFLAPASTFDHGFELLKGAAQRNEPWSAGQGMVGRSQLGAQARDQRFSREGWGEWSSERLLELLHQLATELLEIGRAS